jgi:ABC-type polar amino acid transport system ATPase subunit
MTEAAVRIKNLVKTYVDARGRPTFTAVKDISFDIAAGEFMVLVGPSGCGKSTTLRMVAGLEDISSGTIEIGGEVVNDLEPKDRGIAMVFQNYALYPQMTIFENMAFGLKIAKKEKAFIAETINRTAKTLGLEKMLDRKPQALSGGQRQRVALGRAIVRNPKVFLFDGAAVEPRCQDACSDAFGDLATARRARLDDDLCDPRSGGGDDHGGSHLRDARRQYYADRRPSHPLSPATEYVCGRFHRQSANESH